MRRRPFQWSIGLTRSSSRRSAAVDPEMGGRCTPHPAASLAIGLLAGYANVHGHTLMVTGDYVWCYPCAAHARRLVRDPNCPCNRTAKHKWIRTNLLAGRSPKAKVGDRRIGEPRRLTVDQWLRMQFGLRGAPVVDTPERLQAVLVASSVTSE